ncbi:hypothetical protein ACWD48_27580 [Streptomyces sp. NPDC002519]
MTVTTSEIPAQAAPAGHPVAGELARLLFEGPHRERRHGVWRRTISGPAFSYRPGLPPAERAALSYDRLRLLDDVLDDPGRFAAAPSTTASPPSTTCGCRARRSWRPTTAVWTATAPSPATSATNASGSCAPSTASPWANSA